MEFWSQILCVGEFLKTVPKGWEENMLFYLKCDSIDGPQSARKVWMHVRVILNWNKKSNEGVKTTFTEQNAWFSCWASLQASFNKLACKVAVLCRAPSWRSMYRTYSAEQIYCYWVSVVWVCIVERLIVQSTVELEVSGCKAISCSWCKMLQTDNTWTMQTAKPC